MFDELLKKAFILYLCLTIFEYGLLIAGDSFLKLYGYAIIFIWLFSISKVPNPIKNNELFFVAIYLIIGLFSLIWSRDVDMGSYYLLSMTNMVILISIAATLSWNKKDINNLLLAFQLSAIVFSILLITKGELYHGFFRATLTINGQEQDPNNLSAMLIIPTLISFWKILNKNHIIFNYFSIASNVFAMLLLSSRGGLFGLICGSFFLLLFHNKFSENIKIRSNKLYFVSSLILLSAFVYFTAQYLQQETLQRLTAESMVEGKGSNRLLIWDIAFDQFLNSPFLGIGIGSFQGITKMGVHNQFLIVLVESGIIGFILFFSFLTTLFKKTLNSKTSLLSALLIGTFVVIFFLDAYNKKYFWNAILLSIIILKMEKNSNIIIDKLLQNKI